MITKPLENYMGSVIKVRNNYAYYLEFDRIQNSSGLVTSLVFKFGFFTIPKFFEYRLFRFEKTDLLNHTPALVGNGSTMFLSISIKIFINSTNCFHIKMGSSHRIGITGIHCEHGGVVIGKSRKRTNVTLQ